MRIQRRLASHERLSLTRPEKGWLARTRTRVTIVVVCLVTLPLTLLATASSETERLSDVDLMPSERTELLQTLYVRLERTERPPFPSILDTSIKVALLPQIERQGPLTVSFGVPFAPDILEDDRMIRVLSESGEEIPV